MLKVQNYQYANKNVSFKQNEEKQTNPQTVYKTHAGLKTGATYMGISTAFSLIGAGIYKAIEEGVMSDKLNSIQLNDKELKGIFQEFEGVAGKPFSKLAFTIPLGFAVCMGCGAIIDKINNNKRAKLQADLATKDRKTVLVENSDAEVSRLGQIYHKSNDGLKYGALIGLVAGPIWSSAKNAIFGMKSPIRIVSPAIKGAIGGLILGSITDHYSNKAAKKHADKIATL